MTSFQLDYKDSDSISKTSDIAREAISVLPFSDDQILQLSISETGEQISILSETIERLTALLCLCRPNEGAISGKSEILHHAIQFIIKFSNIQDSILYSLNNEEISHLLFFKFQNSVQFNPKCLSNFSLSNMMAYSIYLNTNDPSEIVHLLHLFQKRNPSVIHVLFKDQSQIISTFLFQIIKDEQNYSTQPLLITKSMELLISNSNQVYIDNFDIMQFNSSLNSFISSLDGSIIQNRLFLYLFSEFNIKLFFQKDASLQIDLFNFFLDLEIKCINFRPIWTRTLILMIESTNFDFDSVLNENIPTLKRFAIIFSEINEITIEDHLTFDIHLFQIELLICIGKAVDHIPEELSKILIEFITIEFDVSLSHHFLIEKFLKAICNLTSSPGFLMDSIVAIPGFLERIVDLIDESSFLMKIHICVIISNLLFEASQYFDEIMGRIDVVGKLKDLIWTSDLQLYKMVCIIFMNLLAVAKEDFKESISLELLDEGILDTFELMLNEIDQNEDEDASFIFEFDEMIKTFGHIGE